MSLRWEPIGRIATLVSVIAAALSAYFSFRSGSATLRSANANLFTDLTNTYSSYEMVTAMRELRQLRDADEEQYALMWIRALKNGDPDAQLLDRDRRLVSRYYQKIADLYKTGLVDKTFVRSVAQNDGLYIYLTIVTEMEKQLNPEGEFDYQPLLSSIVDSMWTKHSGVKMIPVQRPASGRGFAAMRSYLVVPTPPSQATPSATGP